MARVRYLIFIFDTSISLVLKKILIPMPAQKERLQFLSKNVFLKIFPKILFYFFSLKIIEILYKLQNHISPLYLTIMCQSSFMGSCAYLVYFYFVECRYSVNVIIMIIVVFFDGGIFMLKPAYQLLRFSKGERLFVFQKRLLSGVKSSQKLNFTVRLIATFSHLICALSSENEGFEKSRSASNLRKISVPADLNFFSVCHLSFFQNLYHKSEKNSGDKLKKNSGLQELKFF